MAEGRPQKTARTLPIQFSLRTLLVLVAIAAWYLQFANATIVENRIALAVNAFLVPPVVVAAWSWYLGGKQARIAAVGAMIAGLIAWGTLGAVLSATAVLWRSFRGASFGLSCFCGLASCAACGALFGVVVGWGIGVGYAHFAWDKAPWQSKYDVAQPSTVMRVGRVASKSFLAAGLIELALQVVDRTIPLGDNLTRLAVSIPPIAVGLVGIWITRRCDVNRVSTMGPETTLRAKVGSELVSIPE